MTNFDGVTAGLGKALEDRGYDKPTPVQIAIMAPELEHVDLLVSAQTGSGKTVAFGISIASTLLGNQATFKNVNSPLAIIIAPTRELALQVKSELNWLYASTNALVASCVGGMDIRSERRSLEKGAHIVVGTPGRLCDHIKRKSLDLLNIKAVVLDEADEMLNMGFREELEIILKASAVDRRTLMFSATVPKTIVTLAKRYQRDAVRVDVLSDQEQHRDIEYCAYTVSNNERENAIINILRFYNAKTAIVFCATRALVNRMTNRFTNRGFSVVALSGELSQNQRMHALQAIRDGRAKVCIATDVAARGIDLPNLELVIHSDLPKNRESLLHRSGRTGRAGRKGVSSVIVSSGAKKRAERLFQSAKINAKWSGPPTLHEIMQRDDERILLDPILSNPLQDGEIKLVKKLTSIHSSEQLAVAFMRAYRSGQSAPEELSVDEKFESEMDTNNSRNQRHNKPSKSKREKNNREKIQEKFGDAEWFSLSVGRKHTAEARWVLPALIRAGGVDKQDIGAIRILENKTFFEVASRSAEKFLSNLGPSRKLEKSMTVDRIGNIPSELVNNKSDQSKLGKSDKAVIGDSKDLRTQTGDYDRKTSKVKKKKFNKTNKNKGKRRKSNENSDTNDRKEEKLIIKSESKVRVKVKKNKKKSINKHENKNPQTQGFSTLTRKKV